MVRGGAGWDRAGLGRGEVGGVGWGGHDGWNQQTQGEGPMPKVRQV